MTNDFEDRVSACEAALRAACAEGRIFMTGDSRIHEEAAAKLLGLAPGTLANKRTDDSGPAFFRGGRTTYRLRDLAAWVEALRVGR